MQAPLPDFSAYCFENYLGYLKSLIRSRKKPLEQLNARLSELKSGPESKKNFLLRKKQDVVIDARFQDQNEVDLSEITFHDFVLKKSEPDNFVLNRGMKIFQINEIKKQDQNVVITGYEYETLNDVFKKPCKSRDVGIM